MSVMGTFSFSYFLVFFLLLSLLKCSEWEFESEFWNWFANPAHTHTPMFNREIGEIFVEEQKYTSILRDWNQLSHVCTNRKWFLHPGIFRMEFAPSRTSHGIQIVVCLVRNSQGGKLHSYFSWPWAFFSFSVVIHVTSLITLMAFTELNLHLLRL